MGVGTGMKYIALLVCLTLAPALLAQNVEVVELQQPAAGPVLPGSSDHEVMVFRVYKNSGSAASNLTQVKVAFNGTATSADWVAVDLYWDVDRSRTVTGGDQSLATATGLTAGKATFTGFSQPIQDGFFNGYDYLVVVDVPGTATQDNTFEFEIVAADVTVSAGTVSTPVGPVQSNVQTIRYNNGCEIDVREGGVSIISSTSTTHDVGYIPVAGANVNFTVHNTGSGTLLLQGTPLVEVVFVNNCTATVTTPPAASVAPAASTPFIVAVDPIGAATFAFTLQIENNDFDEFPYIVQCVGSAVPLPEIELEYNAAVIDDGDTITLGSYTAGVQATLDITIYNYGDANLSLTGSPIIDFPTEQNVNCVLQTAPTTPVAPAGGSTSFTIRFTPAGSGAWTFVFWVVSNDSDENPYDIQVDGTSPAVTATQLAVHRQPGSANATLPFGIQPIVRVQNSIGAVDTSDNTTVIVASITTGTGVAGASLGGTLTATCVNGYATFTNLSISHEGLNYGLTFTDQSGTLTFTATGPFSVGPAPPKPKKEEKKDNGGGCSTQASGLSWLALCGLVCALVVTARLHSTREK